MTLLERIRQDMLIATKQKESVKLDILKMTIASLKNAEISKDADLDEKEQEQVVRKEVKKLQDAFEKYSQAGRQDLADKERQQLDVLEIYLPKRMTEDEVRTIVLSKVEQLGADSPRDIGKVMGAVMQELSDKADGNVVNNIVKEVLNAG